PTLFRSKDRCIDISIPFRWSSRGKYADRALGNRVTGQLIAGQHETRAHQHDVACESVTEEASVPPPGIEGDHHRAEREQLPELDPDVEREHVRDEAVRGDREVLELRREPEAVKEAEDEDGSA